MQYFLLSVVVGLGLLFASRLTDTMPLMFVSSLLGFLFLTVCLYSIILFKETVQDEREAYIRGRAHHASYLVGMIGLVCIMAWQLWQMKTVYPEAVLLLITMVIVKTGVHWYGERNW